MNICGDPLEAAFVLEWESEMFQKGNKAKKKNPFDPPYFVRKLIAAILGEKRIHVSCTEQSDSLTFYLKM